MPERTYYCPDLKCVYVHSTGEVTLQDVQHSILEVARLAEDTQCYQLIVDVREQTRPLELVDAFTICKDWLPKLPPQIHTAYIVNDPPLQSQSFFKLITDGGKAQLETFYNVEDALVWLNGGKEPKAFPFVGKVQFPGNCEHSESIKPAQGQQEATPKL